MKWSLIVLLMSGLCWFGETSARGRTKHGKSASARKTAKARTTGKVTAKAITKKVTASKKTSKADRRRAKKYWRLGKRLFRKKKYTQAVEVFKKAYRYHSHPLILYNIALVLALDGKRLESAIHLRQYRDTKKGILANLPPVLQQVLDDTAVLVIKTPDPKASILVDGHQVGLGSARITALVGRRAVDIVVKTRIVARRIIVLDSDSIKIWELLEIPTEPVVKPRERPRVPRRIARRAVTPPPKRVVPPPTRWQKMRKLHWAYFVGATGLAAAALGAATGMWLPLAKLDRRLDAECSETVGCTLGENPESQRALTRQWIAVSLFGLSAAAGVAAGVLLLFTRWRKKERSRVTVSPSLAPGAAGVSVRWEFR